MFIFYRFKARGACIEGFPRFGTSVGRGVSPAFIIRLRACTPPRDVVQDKIHIKRLRLDEMLDERNRMMEQQEVLQEELKDALNNYQPKATIGTGERMKKAGEREREKMSFSLPRLLHQKVCLFRGEGSWMGRL